MCMTGCLAMVSWKTPPHFQSTPSRPLGDHVGDVVGSAGDREHRNRTHKDRRQGSSQNDGEEGQPYSYMSCSHELRLHSVIPSNERLGLLQLKGRLDLASAQHA